MGWYAAHQRLHRVHANGSADLQLDWPSVSAPRPIEGDDSSLVSAGLPGV